jgi:hypothetical protein
MPLGPPSKSEAILRGDAGLAIEPGWLGLGRFYFSGSFRLVSGTLFVKPHFDLSYFPLPVPNFRRWYEIRSDNVTPVITTRLSAFAPYFGFTLRKSAEDLWHLWVMPWAPKKFLRALESAGFAVDDRYGVRERSVVAMFLRQWWLQLLAVAIFLVLVRLIVLR